MLKKILGAIVGSILGYIELWIERERREAAEWEAAAAKGQMRAMKSVACAESRIKGVASPRDLGPAAWNKGARPHVGLSRRGEGALFLPLCVLVFVAGCSTRIKYVEGPWPVINRPLRPNVPEQPAEWSPRETILSNYAIILETRVDAYNAEAKEHNRKHGYQ